MTEALTINGVSLDTYALMLGDISGLMMVPQRRGDNVTVPNRHGRIRTLGKKFEANELTLPLRIWGSNPDGSIPSGSNEQLEFFKRRDELLQLLYSDPMLIKYTRPNGHTVQTRGEVLDVLDFTRRYTEPTAQVNVAIEIYDAFWEDEDTVSQNVGGVTGTITPLTAFVGGTAPTSDLIITVFGPCNNPMFALGNTWVKYSGVIAAGRQLTIDTGEWQVGPGSGTAWVPEIRLVEQGQPGAWFEIDPAIVPFQVTFTHTTGGSASASIAGRRKYLSP